MRIRRKIVATASVATLIALMLSLGDTARAAPQETAFASGFGARVHITLFGQSQASISIPPTPYASVPNANGTSSDSHTIIGPIREPADSGQLISDLRVLHASADRTGTPSATGVGQVAHVALFEQNGSPQIAADALHAVAHATCTGPDKASVDADGSKFAAVTLGSQTIDVTPPPNTKIPLVVTSDSNPDNHFGVLAILNEQVKAADGTGIRVTMLHLIVFSPKSPNLIIGDIQLGTAEASVFCGPATAPSETNSTVHSDKVAVNKTHTLGIDVTTGGTRAFRGDTIVWTITISNSGNVGCDLFEVSDTLPTHFTFVKSSGDLTTGVTPTQDGQTIMWNNPNRYPLPAGGRLIEQVTATVNSDAPFGTYTNLFDVNESSCSSFTQGLRGPVEVIPTVASGPGVGTHVLGLKLRSGKLPSTGLPLELLVLSGLALVTLGAGMVKVATSKA
ncbi:MAG: choice-of-anchor P family protein [Actinomycetota bacterium]